MLPYAVCYVSEAYSIHVTKKMCHIAFIYDRIIKICCYFSNP